jgi:hypothetical protein
MSVCKGYGRQKPAKAGKKTAAARPKKLGALILNVKGDFISYIMKIDQ